MKKILKNIPLVILFSWTGIVFASSGGHPLTDVEITQDQEALKRGAMIYYDTCRLCHNMKYISYQNMTEIGFSDKEVDEWRGDRLKSDKFTATTSDEINNELFGMIPPDLSLMAKARKHGPQHIYTLMTSYYEKSENVYDNKFIPNTKMPDIFGYSVATSTEEKAIIENKVKDVTAFLLWASDPRAEERKSLGVYVIAYLILLSTMFYFLMKRVWSRLDKET